MVQIINSEQLDFNDVLIVPQATTINHRGEVDIVRKFKNIDLTCCPIMNANMTQTGTFKVAEKMVKNKMIGAFHKFYTAEEIIKFFAEYAGGNQYFVTVGLRNKKQEIERLKKLHNYEFSILIDVPNAYIPDVEAFVKEIRYNFPTKIIAVGNVCTAERTQELIKAGANAIKIGVGPSAVCRTRHTTGVGRPQLSAIMDCANAAHQVGGLIIADGGFNTIGDFCKAFVAGADICMSGCFFAGTDEASGEIIQKVYQTNEIIPITCNDGEDEVSALDINDLSKVHSFIDYDIKYEVKKFKEYYGMSSFRAQQENYGEKTKTGTSEGVEYKLVPYTGPIIDTINNIKGGLRSCGSYIGAANIKYFSRQGSFYKVNRIQ
nr:MAG TPA: guanosine 5'-monophosphate oxidoreductase [Caudoviricetes sp.]